MSCPTVCSCGSRCDGPNGGDPFPGSGRYKDLGVHRGRDRDRHRRRFGEEPVEIEGTGAQLPRHRAGPFVVDVGDAHEAGAGQVGQMPGVVAAQRAHADHADRQRGGHAGTPRSDDSTKARKRSTSGSGGRSLRARSSACERFRSELKKSR